MKIAYLHNLPLEYYPPATNTLDLLGRAGQVEVRVFSSRNLKNRPAYQNRSVNILRLPSPDPGGRPFGRLAVALWWHLRTAWALFLFRPDALVYVEPHSALAAFLYYRLFLGKARLFIHHHEYYDREDYLRAGMRLPRLGSRLEASYLFPRASWVSQTNVDRLRLMRERHPRIAGETWQILPNYPPRGWAGSLRPRAPAGRSAPLRLVYAGSASFHDTYIEEIVRWTARHQGLVELHVCGYNVADNVRAWLEAENFANVTLDARGYDYADLPGILGDFDVGLVLYKGNTRNFVFNVPNKVFEYLACGLEVWYPREMTGMRRFREESPESLRELNFADLTEVRPEPLKSGESRPPLITPYTAERALEPLLTRLGLR